MKIQLMITLCCVTAVEVGMVCLLFLKTILPNSIEFYIIVNLKESKLAAIVFSSARQNIPKMLAFNLLIRCFFISCWTLTKSALFNLLIHNTELCLVRYLSTFYYLMLESILISTQLINFK